MDTLIKNLLNGDPVALARAITLSESKRSEHQVQAQKILMAVEGKKKGRVIAISGPPGVGKSSFIEVLGLRLTHKQRKVAVLAIDPSSSLTGGSILGDRTRMEELSKSELAFIRPSPSGDYLGGVAAKTREAVILCEAAGFDDVIIETVGVGQSEYKVSYLSDMLILLAQAGSGDDLQGIKRGIMEMANLIIINKADGNMQALAQQTKNYLEQACHLALFHKKAPILLVSALEKTGLSQCLGEIDRYFHDHKNEIDTRRKEQRTYWLRELYTSHLERFWRQKASQKLWQKIEQQVKLGKTSPWEGSQLLYEHLKKEIN